MCKLGAAAPPGGRSALWRVAEHARSGARVDVMMSGPAAERSNGSGPSQSNAAIARRLTQEISITPTKPEATPPESPHPRRPNCLRCSDTPHSRCGTGPISMRSTTDLDAEADRSRRGVRPISAKGGEREVRRTPAQSGRRTRSEPASIRALRPRVGAINSPSTWTGAESVSRMIASVPRRRVTRPSARAGSE